MSLIEWNEDMKLGVPEVDFEHEELIGTINALGDMIHKTADKISIQALLGEINTQIESHFALEEKIMRDQNFTAYEAHKEDHDRLLEHIRTYMDETAKAKKRATFTPLGSQLSAWFTEHFKTLDRTFHVGKSKG